jgi:AcrR family transcriptional regulator
LPKIIENIRELILDEGKKALTNSNYKNLNIREITKACGIGTGTFYNYFKNKEEMAIAIFERDWDNIISSVKSIVKADISLKNKLFQIYLCIDGFLSDHISIFIEMSSDNCSYKQDMSTMAPLYEAVEEILVLHKGTLNTSIEVKKLAAFIIYNFNNMAKTKYITFEEFYSLLVL